MTKKYASMNVELMRDVIDCPVADGAQVVQLSKNKPSK
jgi:hypothetical protein